MDGEPGTGEAEQRVLTSSVQRRALWRVESFARLEIGWPGWLRHATAHSPWRDMVRNFRLALSFHAITRIDEVIAPKWNFQMRTASCDAQARLGASRNLRARMIDYRLTRSMTVARRNVTTVEIRVERPSNSAAERLSKPTNFMSRILRVVSLYWLKDSRFQTEVSKRLRKDRRPGTVNCCRAVTSVTTVVERCCAVSGNYDHHYTEKQSVISAAGTNQRKTSVRARNILRHQTTSGKSRKPQIVSH